MTAFAKRRSLMIVAIVVLAVLALLGAGGCRRAQPTPQPEPTQTTQSPAPTEVPTPPSPSPTTPAGEPSAPLAGTTGGTTGGTMGKPIPVRIDLVRGEKIGVAGRSLPAGTKSVAAATVRQLLEAPSASDKRYSLGTEIPKGTTLLGLNIKNGLATVDLSNRFESGGGSLSMQLRVAQIVGTLQQFPNVKRVAFRINGKAVKTIGGEGVSVSPPVTLNDFEDVLPSILVEGPTPGQTISNPFALVGTANVFEAQFRMRMTQNGKTLVDKQMTATSGSGTRGTFSRRISYTGGHSGAAMLEVYDISEKDGSRIDIVRIPVTLK